MLQKLAIKYANWPTFSSIASVVLEKSRLKQKTQLMKRSKSTNFWAHNPIDNKSVFRVSNMRLLKIIWWFQLIKGIITVLVGLYGKYCPQFCKDLASSVFTILRAILLNYY